MLQITGDLLNGLNNTQKGTIENFWEAYNAPLMRKKIEMANLLAQAQANQANQTAAHQESLAKLTAGITPGNSARAWNDRYTDPSVATLAQLDALGKDPDVNSGNQNAPGNINPVQSNGPLPIPTDFNPNSPGNGSGGGMDNTIQNINNLPLAQRLKVIQQMKAGQAAADTAATENAKSTQDTVDESDKAANLGGQLNSVFNEAKDAYDKSNYKGQRLGQIPAKYLAFLPGSDTAQDQRMDTASQKWNDTMDQLSKNPYVSPSIMPFIAQSFTRASAPGQIERTAQVVPELSKSLSSYNSLMSAAKNAGITDKSVLSNLRTMAQRQRPILDPITHEVLPGVGSDLNDFLSPQAIEAAKNNRPFVSIPEPIREIKNKNERMMRFQNWRSGLTPAEQKQLDYDLAHRSNK